MPVRLRRARVPVVDVGGESPGEVVGRAVALTAAVIAWECLLYGVSDRAVADQGRVIAEHLIRDASMVLPVASVSVLLGGRAVRSLGTREQEREGPLLTVALVVAAFALLLTPVAFLREMAPTWALGGPPHAIDDRFLCSLALSSMQGEVARSHSVIGVLRDALQAVLTMIPAVMLSALLTWRWRPLIPRASARRRWI